MGLFNWLGKKEKHPPVRARTLVWMHGAAKQKGVLQLMKKNTNAVVIAWFPQTQQHWQNYLLQQGRSDTVMIVRQTSALQLVNKTVILLEHYPLAGKESAFLENLHGDNIYIAIALDDPLFNYFGGDRIAALLQAMGTNQDETIEHELVTRAIHNAQMKLEKRLSMENTANSMQEWFEKNARDVKP
ncbi:MAG: hypothetical protein H7122_02090 [Chitinophagaceae bacterium]|nr:hypothetical protein [Chitinophagaceae bacterium]